MNSSQLILNLINSKLELKLILKGSNVKHRNKNTNEYEFAIILSPFPPSIQLDFSIALRKFIVVLNIEALILK